MAKKERKRFNCHAVFSISGVVNGDIDIEQFLKESNDYSAEPKNADGCVIAMHIKDVEILPEKKQKRYTERVRLNI